MRACSGIGSITSAAGAIGPEAQVEAVERLIREQGFTVLNRLCALRMCEERGLVQECVRLGYDSKGFRLYDEAASKLGGDTYTRYSLFLQLLFDEISVDLGVLFDRFALTGLLFPGEDALKQALALINTSKLSHIWIDDEAIGWVYQYFNSSKERRAMRDASAIPRDSRELAVRNQFFTPRYVVEFLTDGCLGRLWYEMRKGNTGLKKDCRYLMGRTSDVFLSPGEAVPPVERNETGSSQEELLRNPAYLVHRPKVDPRDLRVLDPACGSGHFLLYAFDLLERIYEEAWADPESPESKITGRTLRDEFTVLEDLHREVPKRIYYRAQPPWNRYRPPRGSNRRAGPLASRTKVLEKPQSRAWGATEDRPVEHRHRRAHAGRGRNAQRIHHRSQTSCTGATRRCCLRENAARRRIRFAAEDRIEGRSDRQLAKPEDSGSKLPNLNSSFSFPASELPARSNRSSVSI